MIKLNFMGIGLRKTENTYEDILVKKITRKEEEVSSEREDRISNKAKEDYAAYLKSEKDQLWAARNRNIINQIKEAEELLKTRNSYGVEIGFEKREIETDHDEARMVALCRAIEGNKH